MTVELWTVVGAVVLGIVQIALQSLVGNTQRGLAWATGPRDTEPPPVGALAGRLDRALRNFVETFPLFAAAVLVAHVAGRHSACTVIGSEMYLGARVLYVLLYALGTPVVRTVVWWIATSGIVLVLVGIAR